MSSPFDLDQFAPPPVRFKIAGTEYAVDGDPDVDQVARMLRIEEEMEGDNAMQASFEGRELLLQMIQARQPDITELKVSPREILTVFYLVMRGPSVAAAVSRAIANPDAPPAPVGGDSRDSTAASRDGEAEDVDPAGADAPLGSARRSSASSSSSDSDTAGDLVTGIAV